MYVCMCGGGGVEWGSGRGRMVEEGPIEGKEEGGVGVGGEGRSL